MLPQQYFGASPPSTLAGRLMSPSDSNQRPGKDRRWCFVQRLPARAAGIGKSRPCRRTPVSISMTAGTAARHCAQTQAIAASSARSARSHVRQYRRSAEAAKAARNAARDGLTAFEYCLGTRQRNIRPQICPRIRLAPQGKPRPDALV